MDRLTTDVVSHVKYDLIGKIASGTTLTRKTVAAILTKIRPVKFDLFKANPEEFITKVTRLILEQKATMIVEHISYNQVDGEYDSSIFTQENILLWIRLSKLKRVFLTMYSLME